MLTYSFWNKHFRKNREEREEPNWSLPCEEPVERVPLLARSLAHFQLGESGNGEYLLAKSRRVAGRIPGLPVQYGELLQAFVAEEQEHSRLLARMTERLGGPLVRTHWTTRLFRGMRRLFNLDWEIQTLLMAEIVGGAFYSMLTRHCRDSVLCQTAARILREETGHVRFHRDYFRVRMHRTPDWQRRLWCTQFKLWLSLAAGLAWLDHGTCLTALGVTRNQYQERIHHLYGLVQEGLLPTRSGAIEESVPKLRRRPVPQPLAAGH